MRSVSSATWTRVFPVSWALAPNCSVSSALFSWVRVMRVSASRVAAPARLPRRRDRDRRARRRRAHLLDEGVDGGKRRSPRSRLEEADASLRRRDRPEVEQIRLDQLAAAGQELRAHADVDGGRDGAVAGAGRRRRRGRARRSPRAGQVGGRVAELAPALVAVDDLAGDRERRRRAAGRRTRPRRRGRARGCGWSETTSPSTSSSGTTRVSKRSSAASSSRVALGLVAEAEVLPHARRAWRRSAPTSTSSMNVLRAARAANSPSNGMTTSSSTPERRDQLGLALERGQQRRRGARARPPPSGCGSKVRTVSAPRMTSRWPRCTPSNVPTATRRGRGSTSGSGVTSSRAEAYDGLEQRALFARGARPRDRRSGRPRRRAATCSAPLGPSPGTRRPCAARRPASASRRTAAGRPARRRAAAPRRVGVLDARTGPIARAAQLLAVGVAELGDQRADVGPRRALDDVIAALVALAADLLEAVDGHVALGHLEVLAAAGALVGACAPATRTAE